jgi:hypothetical protein
MKAVLATAIFALILAIPLMLSRQKIRQIPIDRHNRLRMDYTNLLYDTEDFLN